MLYPVCDQGNPMKVFTHFTITFFFFRSSVINQGYVCALQFFFLEALSSILRKSNERLKRRLCVHVQPSLILGRSCRLEIGPTHWKLISRIFRCWNNIDTRNWGKEPFEAVSIYLLWQHSVLAVIDWMCNMGPFGCIRRISVVVFKQGIVKVRQTNDIFLDPLIRLWEYSKKSPSVLRK